MSFTVKMVGMLVNEILSKQKIFIKRLIILSSFKIEKSILKK